MKTRTILFFCLGILVGGVLLTITLNQFESAGISLVKKKKKKENISEATDKKDSKTKDSLGSYLDKKLPIKIVGEENDVYENIDNNSSTYDSLKGIRDASTENVNRDQLVLSTKIDIKYLQKEDHSDSLVNKINTIKNTSGPKQLTCEIWKSPINYKGYKLDRQKLVVFGINPDETKMLFDLKDYVILQSGNHYYKLNRTSDFKSLKSFNDEAIINSLK